jgi:GH25 family lysozyme M1 (1,4-beta-N-acetylmuramidase)
MRETKAERLARLEKEGALIQKERGERAKKVTDAFNALVGTKAPMNLTTFEVHLRINYMALLNDYKSWICHFSRDLTQAHKEVEHFINKEDYRSFSTSSAGMIQGMGSRIDILCARLRDSKTVIEEYLYYKLHGE